MVVQKAPWISRQRGFRFFVSRHYATSRRFRHQRAGVSPYCLVRVQVRAGPIPAVSGQFSRAYSAGAAESPAFGRKRRSALPAKIIVTAAPALPLLLPFALLLPFLLAFPLPLLLPRPLLARRDQLPGALLAALLLLRPLLARRDQLLGVLLAALLLRLEALRGRRVRYWSASSPRMRLLMRAFSAAVIASHIPRYLVSSWAGGPNV